ncbi:uncharacterized protein LOC114259878 [Camellia sinensis]|uniref:uncharacterized protein LOC114259878 n=1 Tax=Camellia sinensis TaxID=4442 RepID=UPI001036ECAB|nr:uncharacterized protein LOC114259878 [Camellia sinensis]
MMMFQKCWMIVKGDVIKFMEVFHQNSKLVHGLNNSFVTLIPKSDNHTCLNDFRPISLIGCLYKILAKVPSNRIKQVMPSIISESQSAFVGAKISILVNGSPISEFIPVRGLRQGDPLSPFLFNIVAEGLNILLLRAPQRGLIKGVVVRSNDVRITHLQFPDDTILFCEAEWEEIVAIKKILRRFEVLSELKINYHKSVVCGVGIDDDLSKEFASKLNCPHQSLPLKYLGLPLGATPTKRRIWQPWRFGSEDGVLWKQVICSKYSESGKGWWPLLVVNSRSSQIWKGIMGVAWFRPELVDFFKSKISKVIGDGRRAQFWEDHWVRNVYLKEEFPRLYSLSVDKAKFVNLVLSRRFGFEEGNLCFRSAMYQWEGKDLRRLYEMVYNTPALRVGISDRLKWAADTSGLFSVAFVYKGCELSHVSNSRIVDFIWKNVSPPKV